MAVRMLGPTSRELERHLKDLFREHFGEYLDQDGRLDVPSGQGVTRRSCPVCGGTAAGEAIEFLFFPIVRCNACGFLYMQSFPDMRVLQKAHIDAINSQHPYARAQKPEVEWITEEHVRTKVDLLLEWFRDLSKLVDLPRLAAGTFLDIGAGMGFAVKAAEIYGFRRAIGIEFDSQHVRMARERLNVELVENAVEQIELPGDVSLIRMSHVLEHIERPVELLGRARAVLANPGVLYVGVPNMRALSVRLWWTWHRYFQPVHINYFDAGSLRAAAAAAGFPSVRILTDQFSLKKLLSNPLGATNVGKYYLQEFPFGLASRFGLRLMREMGRRYPAAFDRALIRLFPLWGDNLVCLAHTNRVALSSAGAQS